MEKRTQAEIPPPPSSQVTIVDSRPTADQYWSLIKYLSIFCTFIAVFSMMLLYFNIFSTSGRPSELYKTTTPMANQTVITLPTTIRPTMVTTPKDLSWVGECSTTFSTCKIGQCTLNYLQSTEFCIVLCKDFVDGQEGHSISEAVADLTIVSVSNEVQSNDRNNSHLKIINLLLLYILSVRIVLPLESTSPTQQSV